MGGDDRSEVREKLFFAPSQAHALLYAAPTLI